MSRRRRDASNVATTRVASRVTRAVVYGKRPTSRDDVGTLRANRVSRAARAARENDAAMRFTFLGHAGWLVRDPARLGAVRSRGSRRRTSARGSRSRATTGSTRRCSATLDYLYVSHLHRDHFDPEWLARNVSKQARVLLPEFGIDLLARELGALGFHDLVRTTHGERARPRRARRDDPRDDLAGRRPARRLRDRARRRVGAGAQPERRPARRPRRAARARPVRRAAAAVLGRDLVPDRLRLPARGEGTPRPQQARRRDGAGASATSRRSAPTHVFPCAGPPCFLDPDLFALNDLDRDPANIFPDQPVFLDQLAAHGIDRAHLVVPGLGGRARRRRVHGHASRRRRDGARAVRRQARVPRASTSATGRAGSQPSGRRGPRPGHDLVAELAAWFEPLLERAPITSAGIAGNVVIDVGDRRRQRVHRLRRVDGARVAAASRTSTRSTSTAR